MTCAAVVFCCVIALACAGGFGAPAFAAVVASDAFRAALPFLGILIAARFASIRRPGSIRTIDRVHAALQGLLAGMAYGWWWVEPHALLTSSSPGSLVAMGYLAVAGGLVGLVMAIVAERARDPRIAREIMLGAFVLFLLGGGRIYRAYDHIEAGARLAAALAIFASTLALALASWLALRRRPRVAAAIPALAPAVAGLALLWFASSGAPAVATSRDSVLLVVVDTLRADIADGRFAADPGAMPELERIAGSGVRFTQAVSPAPWTLPATVSLLSGWNPHRHLFGVSASNWDELPGDPRAVYMAGALRDGGYLTSAFVRNPYLRPYFGFDRGFYQFRPYHGRAVDGIALALDWLHDHADSPSFTLLHLMDPHWPYEAPEGFGAPRQPCPDCDTLFGAQYWPTTAADRAELQRRYAAEVRYTDAMLGRLFDTLSAGGILDHSWLIVTADHGEEFWEHGGFLHGHSLYDELLRVPLVIVPPLADRSAHRHVRFDMQVRLEDVAATILDIAGLDTSLAVDGKSLMRILRGEMDITPRVEVSGLVKSPKDLRWSVRMPPWKAVVSPDLKDNRLFDLAHDPGEQHSLLFPQVPGPRDRANGEKFFELQRMPLWMHLPVHRKPAPARSIAPEADTRRQLRSLGYAN
ncbi:MAG TPA: sulfatase-like hydrolase/transferase [Candidatus Binatia bacterium]|jgi:arylsulfatase A-like enzyme